MVADITSLVNTSATNRGDTLTAGQKRLTACGILEAATAAGWHDDRNGWRYRIDEAGRVTRWKNHDSSAERKYFWPDGKPPGYDYYLPFGEQCLIAAIAASGGILHIANGEKGVLTYHAAGLYNVVSWFGETSVPNSLGADCQRWHVRRVVYHSDLDDAGTTSARKVRALLAGTGIECDLRKLPESLGKHGDTNDLWIAVGFDAAAYWTALAAAPALELPPDEPRRDTMDEPFRPLSTVAEGDGITHEEYCQRVNEAVERAYNITKRPNKDGWVNFKNTDRGEKNASAGYNYISGTFHDFTGAKYTRRQLAERFGIPTPARRAKRSVQARERKQSEAAVTPLAQRVKAVELPTFSADETVNNEYISDIDYGKYLAGYRGVFIRAQIGRGKTELIKRTIAEAAKRLRREPTVLVITHRVALIRQLAERLDILSYKDLDGDARVYLSAAPQIATSYDSLWRFAENTYDLVFVDEVTQVHPHLGGGTMDAGEPRRAYSALKGILQRVGIMAMFLDAHNDDIALNWGKAILGTNRTVAIDNAYRAHKGTLTLHSSANSVFTTGVELIKQNAGPVAFPTSSYEESKAIFCQLADLFGAQNGYLINRDNSESLDAQDFLGNINERIAALRFFVYSPSVDTGVDIQTPVRAVCGTFFSQPLAPANMLQMMGRCRHAVERHAFVQDATERNRITDWRELYRIDEVNAVTTRHLSNFAAHNIPGDDDALRGAGKLLAMYRAQRNAAMNDPLSYFAALATDDGYSIQYLDSDGDSALKDARRGIRQTLADERKQATLSAEAVNHDALQAHRRAGTITPEVRAGHERYNIEETVGLTINPQIYDDLHTSAKRARVRRFADMWDDPENLKAADRVEGREGYLLSKRKHRIAARLFMEAVIKQVFGCTLEALPDTLKDIPGDDLERRLDGFSDLYRDQLTRLLGWRPGHHSDNPVALLRWILGKIGLKVVSLQIMRDGRRFRVYSIDAAAWDTMRAYAEARLAHLAAKRAEQESNYLKPDIYTNPVLSNAMKPLKEPPPGDEYSGELARSARRNALLTAIGV